MVSLKVLLLLKLVITQFPAVRLFLYLLWVFLVTALLQL
jgi:hypothetical protein